MINEKEMTPVHVSLRQQIRSAQHSPRHHSGGGDGAAFYRPLRLRMVALDVLGEVTHVDSRVLCHRLTHDHL